jgi:hypothetical protein
MCGPSVDSIFAFANENHKLDVLVVSGSKLVYKTLKMVYVASGNNTVLKSPEQIVLSSNGGLCIVKD